MNKLCHLPCCPAQVMFDARNKQFDTVRGQGPAAGRPHLLHAVCAENSLPSTRRLSLLLQVMAALGSTSERWGIFTVSLEFERRASGSSSEGGVA